MAASVGVAVRVWRDGEGFKNRTTSARQMCRYTTEATETVKADKQADERQPKASFLYTPLKFIVSVPLITRSDCAIMT